MAQAQTMQIGKHAVPVKANDAGYDHDGEPFMVYTPQTHCCNCGQRKDPNATGKLNFRFSNSTYAKVFAMVNEKRVKGGSIVIR